MHSVLAVYDDGRFKHNTITRGLYNKPSEYVKHNSEIRFELN
jgi:hypothetical protein